MSGFDRSQSQYERKLARQKQLDMMEAAASGQTYDPPSVDPSPAGSSHGSPGANAGTPPEGAIESARRFLWDEDEDDDEPYNAASGGGATQQFISGEKHTPGSTPGAFMNRIFGAFRLGGESANPADKASASNIAARRTSLWMSDAQARDSDEFMDEPMKKNSGGGAMNRFVKQPIARFCSSIGDCMLAIFHTIVGACAILSELCMSCLSGVNPRVALLMLGGLVGMILVVFGTVAIISRAIRMHKGHSHLRPPATPSQGEIVDTARFNALREIVVASTFSLGPHLDTTGTAQNLALRWLTDDDPAKLEPDDDAILQRYALAVFYFSTYVASEFQDDVAQVQQGGWKYMDYWMSDKGICLWYGVSCPAHLHEGVQETHYNENSDVIKLNLTDNNIRGTIPSELSALENLKSLDLGKNKLAGSIPKSITKIQTLGTYETVPVASGIS